MQLSDDLKDLGKFDDAISGDMRDPYSDLAATRRQHPVQVLGAASGMPHDESKPVVMVYRHDEIEQVLRDNATYSSAQIKDFFGEVFGEHVMLAADEPRHGRYRALVATAFSPKGVASLEHRIVHKVANELIDKFVDRGSAELVSEFTFPFPAQIIASMLGLPREDYPQFQRWAVAIIGFLFDRDRGLEASKAMADYFLPIIEDRRRAPCDDLISSLVQAEIGGERLSDEEIISFLRLLLPAGVETTYRAFGSLLFGLLSNPDQLEAVRRDRSLVQQTINESLRWEPPLLTITRMATRDTELAGVSIPAGATVMPMLGAANRDELRYPEPNPNRFDIYRPAPKPHISFGYGAHGCLGQYLAQLEMRVALNLLLDRLPHLRLDPEGNDPHIRGQVFRSPTSLPVLFGAPPSAGSTRPAPSVRAADTKKETAAAFSADSTIGELLGNPAAKAVFLKHVPEVAKVGPMLAMARGMTLKAVAGFPQANISPDRLQAIVADLAKL
jgi:cytochrome P450